MSNYPEYLTRTPPKNLDEAIQAMLTCEQTPGQTVFQHGQSVWAHFDDLHQHLKHGSKLTNEWKLPDWLQTYKDKILNNLHHEETIQTYATLHDIGKPYCRYIDKKTGQYHFPNHVDASTYIAASCGLNQKIISLISWDMVLHTASSEEIKKYCEEYWFVQDACTLLLVSFAEIHNNARMFGGIDSSSFKIKWKQLDRRGKQICKHYFETSL